MEEEGDHIRIGLKSACWVVRCLGILPLPIHMIKQLSFSPLSWEANVYSGDNKTDRLQTLRLCMWRYKEIHHTKMDILSKRSYIINVKTHIQLLLPINTRDVTSHDMQMSISRQKDAKILIFTHTDTQWNIIQP